MLRIKGTAGIDLGEQWCVGGTEHLECVWSREKRQVESWAEARPCRALYAILRMKSLEH